MTANRGPKHLSPGTKVGFRCHFGELEGEVLDTDGDTVRVIAYVPTLETERKFRVAIAKILKGDAA